MKTITSFRKLFIALFLVSMVSTVYLFLAYHSISESDLLSLPVVEQSGRAFGEGNVILTLIHHVFTGFFL